MSIIPLDLQRRCERRWAARFARQAPEPSSQKSVHEKRAQQLGAPAKPKKNPPARTGARRLGYVDRRHWCGSSRHRVNLLSPDHQEHREHSK
jgi:hypothetical protein